MSITLDALFCLWHTEWVAWEVEGTDEFAGWFEGLIDDEHVPIADTLYDEYLWELRREGLT